MVRAELKRRECNAMGHAFVCIRRPFECLSFENRVLLFTYLIRWRKYALKNLKNYIASGVSIN